MNPPNPQPSDVPNTPNPQPNAVMSRFDADVEQEFVRKVPAREGQWPRISRYETSTGDGFTIAGSVTALNQVGCFLKNGMLEMGWDFIWGILVGIVIFLCTFQGGNYL